MKRMIVLHDQETHDFIHLPIYDGKFEEALSHLSGDGAETQLVNALGALGIAVYEKMDTVTDSDD